MSKEVMIEELEKLKNRQFMLNMADHWSSDDYELDRKYTQEIKELEQKIAEVE